MWQGRLNCSVDFVQVGHPYKLRSNRRDANAAHDIFKKAYLVALVAMCHEVMPGVPTATFFVLQYNLDIGKFYCKVKVKVEKRVVPRAREGKFLRCNLHCCATHERL